MKRSSKELLIAGVDEVGRGPLAGPVIVAAVILESTIPGVKDSKLLTEKKRIFLAEKIQAEALDYAFGRAEVSEINTLNIHHATLLAMKRAVENLKVQPHKILVDGLFVPSVAMEAEAIVKGDQLHESIAAASIIAKVARDEEMKQLDKQYPQYGFAKHKGYATAEHRLAIQAFGACLVHRKWGQLAQVSSDVD